MTPKTNKTTSRNRISLNVDLFSPLLAIDGSYFILLLSTRIVKYYELTHTSEI